MIVDAVHRVVTGPARISIHGAEIERAITRPQIELLAATVSAANECRY